MDEAIFHAKSALNNCITEHTYTYARVSTICVCTQLSGGKHFRWHKVSKMDTAPFSEEVYLSNESLYNVTPTKMLDDRGVKTLGGQK